MLPRASVSMLRRMQPIVRSRLPRQFSRTGTIRSQARLYLSCLGGGIAGLTLSAAGLFGWFDEWLKKFGEDVDVRMVRKQIFVIGLGISGFFGVTLVVCHFRKKYPSSFHLLYTEPDVARELRKYQPRVFKSTSAKLLRARSHRLEMLKQSVCYAFKNDQMFYTVTGPHGVGKSLLAEHLAAELSLKGNDLCDLRNLGVIYWECVAKEADNTKGILGQFGDLLGEIGVASMGEISYSELFRVLRAYLPKDQTILMIFDAVSKEMEGLGEFQKQVRHISQLRKGSPQIKVMVFASDSYDFGREEEEKRYENRGRVIHIMGFTLEEMTEWVEDFLKTNDAKLVNVPQETSAAESVDPQAMIPQDDAVKKEVGADWGRKEMKDTKKLASVILEHEWNMNEVADSLRECMKPDPDDEKKQILDYADVAENLEYILHVTYKWEDLKDEELCSTFLRLLCEVDPQKDNDGRIFYEKRQLRERGLSVKQIKMLCRVDLAVQVRTKKATQIFIHPQLYHFARYQPHRNA